MTETTKKQAQRLLAAGYPDLLVRMDGHHVYIQPEPLGRLWDAVHRLDAYYHFRSDLTSEELIEELVAILENHYRNRQ